ncbi:MAG: hypothetical protein JXB32_09200 [Deltaproteobacteria bacterium]|nr:hypothetical protein [Deltaproteobacteria bacterium]
MRRRGGSDSGKTHGGGRLPNPGSFGDVASPFLALRPAEDTVRPERDVDLPVPPGDAGYS